MRLETVLFSGYFRETVWFFVGRAAVDQLVVMAQWFVLGYPSWWLEFDLRPQHEIGSDTDFLAVTDSHFS